MYLGTVKGNPKLHRYRTPSGEEIISATKPLDIQPGQLKQMETPALEPVPQEQENVDFSLTDAELLAMIDREGGGGPERLSAEDIRPRGERYMPEGIERLSAEQLRGSPESQAAYHQMKLQEAYGGGGGAALPYGYKGGGGTGIASINPTADMLTRTDPNQISIAEMQQLEAQGAAPEGAIAATADVPADVPTVEELTAEPDEPGEAELGATEPGGGVTKKGVGQRYEEAVAQHRKDYEATLKGLGGGVDFARKNIDKAKSALETATSKLRNWEINPNRAFSNTFSKVAAVLGVAMGAYAQGLSGGKLPNTAMDIVKGAIDKDIAAQKMEFDKLKGLVDERRNVYAMGIRLLGSEQQAKQMAMTVAYRALTQKTKETANLMGFEIDLAKLEETEKYHEGLLANAAAKAGSESGIKNLPPEMRKALTSYGSITPKMKVLWRNSKKMNRVTSFFQKYFMFGEQPADTYDRKSNMATKDIVHSLSGVAVRQEEFEQIDKWTPKSTDTDGQRAAKIMMSMEYGIEKGASMFRTLPANQKALIARNEPGLAAMYNERDPGKRQLLIMATLADSGVDVDSMAGLSGGYVRGLRAAGPKVAQATEGETQAFASSFGAGGGAGGGVPQGGLDARGFAVPRVYGKK